MLPAPIASFLDGWESQRVVHGESGARVTRYLSPDGHTTHYLKQAPVDPLRLDEELVDEALRLRWLRAHGHAVPEVLASESTSHDHFLLTSAVPGRDASQRWPDAHIPAIVDAIAIALRRLHDAPLDDCPFHHERASRLVIANRRFAHGRTGADATAEELEELHSLAGQLPGEDLVLTHGDYCLPNVILLDAGPHAMPEFSGFVDCGRAGRADRHQDLALALRSLRRNLGTGVERRFLAAYGLVAADRRLVDFYERLDVFF